MDPDLPEVKAAGFLAVVGFFDLAGTTSSGWLTDRFNSRYLLFWSYALRGLTLLFLPSLAHPANGLSFFECFLRPRRGRHGSSHCAVHGGHLRQRKRRLRRRPDRRVASARSFACSLRDAFWLSGGFCLLAATV